MELSDFFSPVEISTDNYADGQLGKLIDKFLPEGDFPEIKNYKLAILGVEEDRQSVNNIGCENAANHVRPFLYKLYSHGSSANIVDLGNIKRGHTIDDTYFALNQVIQELLRERVLPIIIGGGQDLTYANYKAYESMRQTVNMLAIDPMFDMGDAESILDSNTYLGKIILQQPNYLFNYSNIGYQTYFAEPKTLELISKLYFDAYRLGETRSKIEDSEPIIRNADFISFDISAIRFGDAPGCGNTSPNGFYGEEACQLAKYAGMSDKLSSIGFYEFNPSLDKKGQTAHLLAQMLWCFIDGFNNRKNDMPLTDTSGFTKFRVNTKEKHEILFYKSNKSDRWWMDVPYPPDQRLKYERHHLVPCTYNDYVLACSEEMPDRWWQTYQKLS